MPSCQGEHHRGLACWLRGDGKLGGSVNSATATSFSEGTEVRCSCYGENTDTENKLLCTHAREQSVRKLEAQQGMVPQCQRGPPFAICYRHVRGGKKGQFCNLEGERKESSHQNSLSLARNSLSAALLTALKLWGVGVCVSLAWTHGLQEHYQREWCASNPCGMPGVAKEKLFQVQLSYNLFFLTDHYCCRLYK